jgi:DnaJ family protein B protein 6
MASGLYELLGIARDASPEQVRKAYKKKALETHPDRLPPGATPDQKLTSEDNFRKVNNAYEVLNDPTKRKEYDTHGVWPIPEVDDIPTSRMPGGSHYRSYPRQRPPRAPSFQTPLFPHDPFASFFTDPFTLFNSIFDDMPHHSSGPRVHSHSQSHSPFRASPFSEFNRMQADIEGLMGNIDRDPFGVGPMPWFPPRTRTSAFPSADISQNEGGGGRWVSNSFMSTTVNGVTQTIQKQKDANGNERITRTFPDGRQVHTINGVEQPPRGHVGFTDNSKNVAFSPSAENRYLPPPVASSSRMDYGVPSPYQVAPPSYHENGYSFGPRERSRRSSEYSDDRQPKKRWWHGGQ